MKEPIIEKNEKKLKIVKTINKHFDYNLPK